MATDKKVAKAVEKKDGKQKQAPARKARKFNLKKTAIAIGHFFRDVVSELKKVSWPSRKEFISYSIAVLAFVAIFGLIIFVMDITLGQGLTQLVGLISA